VQDVTAEGPWQVVSPIKYATDWSVFFNNSAIFVRLSVHLTDVLFHIIASG